VGVLLLSDRPGLRAHAPRRAKLRRPRQPRPALPGIAAAPAVPLAACPDPAESTTAGGPAARTHPAPCPTQAAFACDGRQYACGSHAIRRILPLGNIAERGVFESIRAGLAAVEKLPQTEQCYGCALATLYINQSVEAKLKEKLESMLAGKSKGAEGEFTS